MTSKHPLSRRRFLQGAGGVAVALPFLEAFERTARAQSVTRPKRIIAIGYPMGAPYEHWMPTGPDGNLTLPRITAPFEPIKNKCLFVSRSTRGVVEIHAELKYGHPVKKETAFTGTLPVALFQSGNNDNHIDSVLFSGVSHSDYVGSPANNESIETLVGNYIRNSAHSRASINLSVGSHRSSAGYSNSTNAFFWEGRGAGVTSEYNPKKAFDDLFSGLVDPGGSADPVLDRLRARNKSVLDAVRENFSVLRRDLGAEDRQRLDAHAQRIRDIELEIQYAASCSAPTFGSEEMPSSQQGSGESDRDYMDRLFGETNPGGGTSSPMAKTAPLMVRILAHAMACDIAPVGRLAFTEGDNPFFGIPSIDDEIGNYQSRAAWHTVAHHADNTNARTGMPSRPRGGGPGYYAPELLDGMRFFWQQMADLCILLNQIPDGVDGETALDNSLVVMTSDLGEGDGHGPSDTCFAMAGNFAGGRGGRSLRLDQLGYHDTHVLVSIANIFDVRDGNGAPINEFGLRGFVQGNVPQIFQP